MQIGDFHNLYPPKDVREYWRGIWNAYGRLKTCLKHVILKVECGGILVQFKERVVHDCLGEPVQCALPSCVNTFKRINIYFFPSAIHS
jgi:hypothetical protein